MKGKWNVSNIFRKMPCKLQWKSSKILVKFDWNCRKIVVKFELNRVEILRNSYSGCCSSKSDIRVCWNLMLCRRILCFPRFSDRRIFVNVRGSLSCFRLVSIGSFPIYSGPESDEKPIRSDRCSPEEIGFRSNPTSDSMLSGKIRRSDWITWGGNWSMGLKCRGRDLHNRNPIRVSAASILLSKKNLFENISTNNPKD